MSEETGGGKLKTAKLLCVVLLCLSGGAALYSQDKAAQNSTASKPGFTVADGNSRPAETELLLEEPGNVDNAELPFTDRRELPGVGFGDFLRMILVLGFVIALIYGFVWLLRRFTTQKGESEETINLLSTRPLKGDASLHLVEVGGKIYMLGSGSGGVNLLAEISDEDSVNEIRLNVSRDRVPAAGGFARLLKERFGGLRGPRPDGMRTEGLRAEERAVQEPGAREGGAPAAGSPDSLDASSSPVAFLQTQKERLKKL